MLSTAFLLAASIVIGQSEEAATPTAEDYLAFVRPWFTGTWRYEVVTLEGKVVARGDLDAQIGPHQRCAVTTQTVDGETTINTAIHGYDPSTKYWRVVQFSGDDSMLVMEVRIDLKTLKAGKYENVTYSHRNTLTKRDGTQSVSTWQARIVDRNTLELNRVSGETDGVATIRFVRK